MSNSCYNLLVLCMHLNQRTYLLSYRHSPIAAFRAVIELLSGAEAIEESVDGKISYGDFYQQMQSKYSSQGGIGRITFLDNELSDSVENTDEFQSLAAIKTVPSSSEKNYVIALMIDSPLRRTLWETSAESETSASSSSSSRPTAENEAKGSNQGGWAAAIFGTQRPGTAEIRRTCVELCNSPLCA